ncbi:MAG: M36 family metallopeptidase, partial [Anaerolineales bacterium]
ILGITEGQNQLKGQYVDLTAPGIIGGYKPAGLASEPSREYVYPCDDDRFEEVMVYYHVDAVQRAIQELGFTGQTGIMNRPIPAHAHFVGGFLSFYSKINRGIHFSDGSVTYPADAAEDADVIIHEYGHAIQDDQVPGWGLLNLLQTRSMGEGFSDFLAAALTGDPCLGEWFNVGIDACSPGIRTLENGVTWNGTAAENLPTWCDNGNDTHCAGLIWGGALWDLVEVLGDDQSARDLVLRLILDAHFYMDPESDFGEALAAIRQADTDLYAGLHLSDIDAVFANRGISLDDLSDFPYVYYRIRHPLRGDLGIQILVGDVANPDCTMNLRYPIPADSKADIVDYVDLESGPCEVYLPPTTSRPWRLQVRDAAAGNTGTIEDFVIALAKPPTQRCIATDVPVSIPDDDGFVYSVVDCRNLISLLPYQIFLPLVAHD